MTRKQLLDKGKQQADKWLSDNWRQIKAKQNITIKKDSANSN